MNLQEDPRRVHLPETGIPVRAKRAVPEGQVDRWGPVDINHLTRASLLEWLRMRSPELAENLVLTLLGHER